MKVTSKHNDRIANMKFSSVYPHYVTKVEKKGRTKEELHQVIEWLTGFDESKIQKMIDEEITFETFFERAELNPNAHLIVPSVLVNSSKIQLIADQRYDSGF